MVSKRIGHKPKIAAALALVQLLAIQQFCYGQDSTSTLGLNLYSSAFFDNKEFTGDIKKGYTLPGFFIQPVINFSTDNYSVEAGFHLLYMAGTDSLEHLVPVLTLARKLSKSSTILVGTLDARNGHFLPEPLFKPERAFTSHPETGVQLKHKTNNTFSDLWINWEQFIKTGSPFQEQFTVGFTFQYLESNSKTPVFFTKTMALATHQGGQIDSTNLPVTTIVNIGETAGILIPLKPGNANLSIEVSGFLSADKSPNPHLKYDQGYAFYPRIQMEWPFTRFSFGYWHARSFINPRGEELFGSLSTVNPTLDSKVRRLVTCSLEYSKTIQQGFTFGVGVNGYYDTRQGLLDYSYTFRMIFDGELVRFRRTGASR